MSNSALLEKRKAWDVIFDDPNLAESSLRQRAISGKVCRNGLRSVCWKIYLKAIPTLDLSKWPELILQGRQRYAELHRNLIDIPQEQIAASKTTSKVPTDATNDNPLGLNDDNPWQQHFADAEVRKIIRQDVERTFPDVDFFRDPAVQNQMTDVLFIYCKLNDDVSYRQGMHELLAPIFLVLNSENLDIGDGSLVGPADSTTKLMAQVLDKKFLEHDSYIVFDRLMAGAKKWYEFNDDVPTRRAVSQKKELDLINPVGLGGQKTTPAAQLTPIVKSCRRIQHQLLKNTDPALYNHLESLGIEPQLYGMQVFSRWLRLLFGREFSMENLLQLWDAIFAEDPSLNIVEYVSLVLLIRIRDKLIEGEYAECLTLLMRYPHIKDTVVIVEQAKYLRDHLTEEACLQLLRQNDVKAGKPPRETINLARPTAPANARQRRAPQAGGSAADPISKLTKDMMQNPQIREINRALVGVMGAVQKNMNTFGENVLGLSTNEVYNGPRGAASQSNFPDAVDRLTDAVPQYNPYQQPANPPKPSNVKAAPTMAHRVNKPLPKSAEYNDLVDNLREVNAQMGRLLGKCVNVLERELFPDIEGKEEKGEEKGLAVAMKEEASVIMALVGIKHVRDVLLGKQRELDVSVANQIAQMHMNENTGTAGEETEDRPVATADAIQPKATPPAAEKESAKRPVAEPRSDLATKAPAPAPSNIPNLQTKAPDSQPKALDFTYISPHPLPSKPSVTYNIDDLLSDTLKDEQVVPARVSKDKFSWMMESNQSSPTSKKSGTATGPLFSSTSPGSSRSATSANMRRPGNQSLATNAVSVDPLDARNADKRKLYDL